jgi:hypothetical protein
MVDSVVLFVTQVECQGAWSTTAWSTTPAIYVQGVAHTSDTARLQRSVMETIRFDSPAHR